MRLAFRASVVLVLMVLAGTLLRSQPWRPDPLRITLPSGRTVHLEHVITTLEGSACRLLTFEYVTELSPANPDELRAEAKEVLEVAGADSVYRGCAAATVVAREVEGEGDRPPAHDRVFKFGRRSPGGWTPLAPGR